MSRNIRSRALRDVSAVALLTLLAAPVAAQTLPPTAPENATAPESTAQDTAADQSAAGGQDVVVTGSRIARPEFETLQPTQVVGAAQIANRGYTNVGQVLSEIPAFGPPGNSGVGAQSSFGPAQTFVDFFGLGTQRTLVLVNGRRFVSSNTASIFGPVSAGTQVDLNNIPTSLVERVETVAIGGAPIYGSDAIAGTVNIILKRDFDGLQLQGQAGVSQRAMPPINASACWRARTSPMVAATSPSRASITASPA
ncbi:hypothetical protein GCM10020258_30210 [Sphingomonas yabuuchiae]